MYMCVSVCVSVAVCGLCGCVRVCVYMPVWCVHMSRCVGVCVTSVSVRVHVWV